MTQLVSRCPSSSEAIVQPEGPFPCPAVPPRVPEDAREEGVAEDGPQRNHVPARGGTARWMQAVECVCSSVRSGDSKPRGEGERRPSPWGDSMLGAFGGMRTVVGQPQTPSALSPAGQLDLKVPQSPSLAFEAPRAEGPEGRERWQRDRPDTQKGGHAWGQTAQFLPRPQ